MPIYSWILIGLTTFIMACGSGEASESSATIADPEDDADPTISLITACVDVDGDGFTVTATDDGTLETTDCSVIDDCDDLTSSVYPDAAEILDDGIDQNCDGSDVAASDDTDGDGTSDGDDNCPSTYNYYQLDGDGDAVGDDCDLFPDNGSEWEDTDGDGVGNNSDVCDGYVNPEQTDTDGDGVGDECDDLPGDPGESNDADNDGIGDNSDVCPTTYDPDQFDTDGDGEGNVCDSDTDGDGISDDFPDNCVLTANAQQNDDDDDGIGNLCEDDADGDGIGDDYDLCPGFASPDNGDADGDGVGDACDSDDVCGDGEGGTYYPDADGDGYGDPAQATVFCGDADAGYVTDNTDCDDTNAGINPGASDFMIDHNCDGEYDNPIGDWDFPDLDIPDLGDLFGDGGDDGDVDESDADGDGVADDDDNCDSVVNADQDNHDSDSSGDACDSDDDGDGVSDSRDNCPEDSNADQADIDDDDKGDACDNTSDFTLDKATAVFRGFKLDFTGTNAFEIDDVGAGFWGDSHVKIDDNSDGEAEGVEIDTNAMLTKSDDKDVAYNWENHYTGILYDSSTMKVYRSSLSTGCWNSTGGPGVAVISYDDGRAMNDGEGGSYGSCYISTEIDVSDKFGTTIANNPDDYVFYVAVDGFKLKSGDGYSDNHSDDQDPIGGEDMIVSAYIWNSASQTHASDKDNDAGTASNENDHYAGADGLLRVYVTMNYNGPESVPDYYGKVWFNIIALKKDVWGAAWYSWNAGSVSDYTSTVSLTGLTDLRSESQAFVILHSLGFNGDRSGTYELDRMSSKAYISSVSSETATVKINGRMYGYEGWTTSADPASIKPDETDGYLIWCKDSSACKTKEADNSESEGAASDDSGDSVDSATETVTP